MYFLLICANSIVLFDDSHYILNFNFEELTIGVVL